MGIKKVDAETELFPNILGRKLTYYEHEIERIGPLNWLPTL